jgi:hypothetical protein
LLPILALSFGFTLAACAGADDDPRVTTTLDCNQPTQCTLLLSSEAGFTVTVLSTACIANDDEMSIISPFDSLLTSNVCGEAVGKAWTFTAPGSSTPPPPYPAGTRINIQFITSQFANPPGLRVIGDVSPWRVEFEDGGDSDFDDLILTVAAVPPPS